MQLQYILYSYVFIPRICFNFVTYSDQRPVYALPIELGTIVLDPSPFGANFPPLPKSLSYFLELTVRPVEPGPVGSPTILVL